MCLNLNDYQFKTSRYSYRSTYMNPMVTIIQKPTTDTEKQSERNTSIPLNKITESQGKKLKEEQIITTRTGRKQVKKCQ